MANNLKGNNPIITIIGRSSSGKTTVIERLIKYLNNKGYKISIIKHIRNDFVIDHKGKDSYRFKEAGAISVAITNDLKFAIISDIVKPLPPIEIAKDFLTKDSDLVIIEGFKEFDIPKIEVIGKSSEPPLYKSGIKNIECIISDKITDSNLPQFKRDDIEGIANFIEKKYVKASN